MKNSPFDVYAWKGNYAPYRFNLDDFVPIVAGNKDHIDPSSHLVLSVSGDDGVNFVELVCFAPRFNCTNDKEPTYLPPYDHRNNGKAEIMHYLGGYDARQGLQAGDQSIHDMGVAHGNDENTFIKARHGENKSIYLNNPCATMIEVTGFIKVTKEVLENQDKEYSKSLIGTIDTASYRPIESEVGKTRQLTFTAYERSLVPLFDVLMPNPSLHIDPATGHTVRQYVNANGDVYLVNSNQDLNLFWNLYNNQVQPQQVQARDHSQLTNQQLTDAVNTIQSFLNRGTVVQAINMEVDHPEKTAQYYLKQGFFKGLDHTSVSIEENSPLNFKFIPKDYLNKITPNSLALVSTIDHTVINCYKSGLDKLFNLLPHTFWGGDPRDLRAPGVQFYTRVLTNNINKVPQMIPVNNLDESEEELLIRIQKGDSFVPPYIQDAVMNNQICRGLFDTNRTKPTPSFNAFLQHIAMAVNQKYGDISEHLHRIKSHGLQLIPPPPIEYYRLSEIDLVQRLILPTLFRLEKYDAFQLPYELFNGLLKPKDACVNRLRVILEDKGLEKEVVEDILRVYHKMRPVLQMVAEQVNQFNLDQFKEHLTQTLNKQQFEFTSNDVEIITKLVLFNKNKILKAQEAGSLLDFQIIQQREQSGYIDQTFSVPVTQQTEGTSGIFFEFILRTCYDDVFELIEMNKLIYDQTSFKSCGAFGQGNFANLMLGQQKGIESVDLKIKEMAKKGQGFQLPILDLETIHNKPTEHLHQHIQIAKNRGDDQNKIQSLINIVNNLESLINLARERKIWAKRLL